MKSFAAYARGGFCISLSAPGGASYEGKTDQGLGLDYASLIQPTRGYPEGKGMDPGSTAGI